MTEAALKSAIAQARQTQWLQENVEAFAAQAAWHERNGQPLADIMIGPSLTAYRVAATAVAQANFVER